MTSETPSASSVSAYERVGVRIVALLLVLELFSVFFLWVLNPIGPDAEDTFALYLGADLVSFAMISYIYRAVKRDDRFGRAPLVAGCCFVVVLLLLGFAL